MKTEKPTKPEHTPVAKNDPAKASWRFIRELSKPVHTKTSFSRKKPLNNEISLHSGAVLIQNFPDPLHLLDTAYADFRVFIKSAGIKKGLYPIRCEKNASLSKEAYTIEVRKESCLISASDTEGIRRALVSVEDEIISACGIFLKTGIRRREPCIKTRISRCFFGPLRRPPFNRNELADDIDYYPDGYLNRLAHEAVNGLWLTISFDDLVPSKFFPEHGKNSEKMLAKLKKSVDTCARYGIRLFVFCIEPKGFGNIPEYMLPADLLRTNPYFAGHRRNPFVYFCTSTKEAQEYLEEATFHIFSKVPGLGGLIDINFQERPTHCYSAMDTLFDNNCPRCSKMKPGEVFAQTVSAMKKGMAKASPSAELISWLYNPAMHDWDGISEKQKETALAEIAGAYPKDVTIQFNFESNGRINQLGNVRRIYDYSLAWPGPADVFAKAALSAQKSGVPVSAKIQVGCSHELATVPFIPVPGNLYQKYREMRKYGVTTVMQCWYFGNYPGLMNKAAGELSFNPFPGSEKQFLLRLGQAVWGTHAKTAAEAWSWFTRSYRQFPANLSFSWYGPLHDCIAWPLFLYPADMPIAPSWKFAFPETSGDRVPECFAYMHSWKEIITLLTRMDMDWSKGMKIFSQIAAKVRDDKERLLDINLARAIGLQIRSAKNVFTFYQLREDLPFIPASRRKTILKILKNIVRDEIKNSLELTALAEVDPRLGYHSEAEAYKYNPAKLKKRASQLSGLLKNDFPRLEKELASCGTRTPLWPEYTGSQPKGSVYLCAKDSGSAAAEYLSGNTVSWKAWHEKDLLIIEAEVQKAPGVPENEDELIISIEPRRLYPVHKFLFNAGGKTIYLSSWTLFPEAPHFQRMTVQPGQSSWKARLEITRKNLPGSRSAGPVRLNIIRQISDKQTASWVPLNPYPGRLVFGTDNPKDLGWLV